MVSSLQMSQAEGVGGGGGVGGECNLLPSECGASGGDLHSVRWGRMDKRAQVVRQHPNLMD
jgi:hypothetical protein